MIFGATNAGDVYGREQMKTIELLIRCYTCDPVNGRENYAPAVATGRCAWCGADKHGNREENPE
jgi:hypothetical protein